MASQGATLQSCVNDLVRTLEEMKDKREMLRSQILEEEEERTKVEKEINILSDRLEKINELLVKKSAEKRDLEKTVADTEIARSKIVESFKTLLNVLQRESHYLKKK